MPGVGDHAGDGCGVDDGTASGVDHGGDLVLQGQEDALEVDGDGLVPVRLAPDRPDGRMRLFELGSFLGWEKSRLSHHVARMVKRELVEKEACDDDRRGAFVVITDKGRADIEAAAPGHLATVRRLFVDHLDEHQLDQVGDIAEIVLASLDLHFGDPDPRQAEVGAS